MRGRRIVVAAAGTAFALLSGAAALHAQEVTLEVGDAAPGFEGMTDEGEVWRSADHVGNGYLVVYFYPAAMTGGCTAQACSFRDNRSTLQELGAEVVGVSGDRIEGLRTFRGANRLNFPLVSDTAGTIARAFGVPIREGTTTITREVDGKEVELTRDLSAARWTFIIGPDGRIAYKETRVDPEGDGEAVVAAIRKLANL